LSKLYGQIHYVHEIFIKERKNYGKLIKPQDMKAILLLFYFLPFMDITEESPINQQIHEYYVSTCDINFNEPKQRLEITIEFDTKDMEKALQGQTETKLRIGSRKEAPETDVLLLDYLTEHFIINLNNKPAKWQFLGKEVEDYHHLWVYLQVEQTNMPETIELTHNALIDLFEQQSNIVHATIGASQETLVFQKGLETQKFVFK